MPNPDPKTSFEEAAHHFAEAVRLAPEESRYAVELGKVRFLLGDVAGSIPHLEKGIGQGAPPQLALMVGLGHMETGSEEEAEKHATAALTESPSFFRAWALRAECRYRRGAIEEAIEDLRKACESPHPPDAWRIRLGGWILERALMLPPSEQRQLLTEGRDILLAGMPEVLVPEWRYVLGCTLTAVGEPRRAAVHLKRTDFPSKAEVALRLGLCSLLLGRHEEAPAYLGEAAEDPVLESIARELMSFAEQETQPVPGSFELPPPCLVNLSPLDRSTLLPPLQTTGAAPGGPEEDAPAPLQMEEAPSEPPEEWFWDEEKPETSSLSWSQEAP